MTIVVYGAVYAGTFVFLLACAVRAVRYARLPVHLRWELYPVPHESAGRAAHGGSYLEEGDWWTKPRRRDLGGEIRFMVAEMVFLKGLWEWNRRLWYRSFPFHFGLYLLACATAILVAFAAVTIGFPETDSLVRGTAGWLYRGFGGLGAVLAFGGALGLLHRRLTDPALRVYSVPADIFNLAFFIVTIAILGAGYVAAGPGFPGPLTLTRAVLRFDTGTPVPALLGAGLILASALAAYIPLTHMSHFIAKYFTYHAVRWDDAPNEAGSALARRIAASLAMRPTWSAAHVAADGTKTWADVAMVNPAAGGKK